MLILIIAIIALGTVAAVFGLISRNGNEQPVEAEPTCATCTGDNNRCEQDCMLEAAVKDIEYYDDEHLDKYAMRPSDSYNDDEVEEFAEVLYTMQPTEVAGWNRSLILRQINLPDPLKDEVIELMS